MQCTPRGGNDGYHVALTWAMHPGWGVTWTRVFDAMWKVSSYSTLILSIHFGWKAFFLCLEDEVCEYISVLLHRMDWNFMCFSYQRGEKKHREFSCSRVIMLEFIPKTISLYRCIWADWHLIIFESVNNQNNIW